MEKELDASGSVAERDANKVIEALLVERIRAIEGIVDADVLTYIGPIFQTAADEIKDAVELLAGKRPKLLVIIETPGGYVDHAERIARIFRHHYKTVAFLVPSFAMSAGTVLVMSGDSIYMDYSSVLGPIDPQVQLGDELVPALGYLVQYERLVAKSRAGKLTTAELAYLLENFDAAQLYRHEQERELSIALLGEWLAKYKFKGWTETATRKIPVTKAMREKRAREIAQKLNDTERWHSHSRGIPMDVLRRDLKLVIDDFGAVKNLGAAVHDYYRLLRDYMLRRGHRAIVRHTRDEYVGA